MATTIFVCTACRRALGEGPDFEQPGGALADALAARLGDDAAIHVERVDCLAVCKRPCTLAFAASGKWTYLIGDVGEATHVDDILAAAIAFEASETGILPWRERPQIMRKGVVARIPPLPGAFPLPEKEA